MPIATHRILRITLIEVLGLLVVGLALRYE
jgi:hypothetical protein